MDENFSDSLNEILKNAREIAIKLGYNYISTFHLFLADCKLKQNDSLYDFSFSTTEQFNTFFESAKLTEENKDLEFESLPITLEAESAIKDAEVERILYKQSKTHPCHLFLASSKVKDSLFKDCFKEIDDLSGKLIEYYTKLGAFEVDKLTESEIENQYYNPEIKSNFSFKKIFGLAKRK